MNLTSQKAAILWHLKQGKGITALEALRRFGCLRLASRIYDLRWDGHEIKRELCEVKHKRVAQYWLVKA